MFFYCLFKILIYFCHVVVLFIQITRNCLYNLVRPRLAYLIYSTNVNVKYFYVACLLVYVLYYVFVELELHQCVFSFELICETWGTAYSLGAFFSSKILIICSVFVADFYCIYFLALQAQIFIPSQTNRYEMKVFAVQSPQ